MKISLAKLNAIILYFANNTNPQYLGKVKLMKLFYYLDFTHLKKYGTPITGDQYFHLEKGPIPSAIMNLIGELATDPESSKLAGDITVYSPEGTRMLQVKALRDFNEADEALFGKSELQMLKEVTERFADESTDSLIETSHKEAPWRETRYAQKIPYELAAHDGDSAFTEEELRFLASVVD